MPDFSMCYYDYCTRPEICQRSPKSGTKAREYQPWTTFVDSCAKQRKTTETCTGFYPIDSYEPE